MVQRKKAREQAELESPEVVHTPEDSNPKLTQCKTCKQKISKAAKVCPHCGEKNPGLKNMGPGCMVFFLAVVFIYYFIAFGLDGDGNNHVQTTTPEYRMAALDAGWKIEETDPSINRYRYLINTISRKTGEPKERISDITYNGQQELFNRYGKEITLLEIMEQANIALSGVNAKISYAEVVSALIVLTGE
jgi:hypothetical protein